MAISRLARRRPRRAPKRDEQPQIYWNEKKKLNCYCTPRRLHRTRYIFPRLRVRAQCIPSVVRVSEMGSGRRVARAAKRLVMWALPVLRTRSYLGAAVFHAHAASSDSLSPCDLYLVNLGSVVKRPLGPFVPRSSEHPAQQRQHWSERDDTRSPMP